jgi:uncharacterized protein (TIGR03083 family)
MEHGAFLDHLVTEAARLRTAAGEGLDARVPTCDGWVVRDVVEHVAEVYEHKLRCVELAGPAPEPWPPVWPPDRDPLAWFDDALDRLLSALRSTSPSAPSWTWLPEDQTAGFWARRMAHETAVHRVDVDLAHGREVTPVDADLALDGVDEVLLLMLAGDWTGDEQPDLTGDVTVAAGDRVWAVDMQEALVGVTAWRRDPGAGGRASGTEVSGEPSDLLLWLWGRADDAAVSVQGDPAVVQRLRSRVALATQ